MVFVFGLQCLEPKNKGQMNVYECCDLTKKVYLKLCYQKIHICNLYAIYELGVNNFVLDSSVSQTQPPSSFPEESSMDAPLGPPSNSGTKSVHGLASLGSGSGF